MCGYGNEKRVTKLYETYSWVDMRTKIEEKVVNLMIVH